MNGPRNKDILFLKNTANRELLFSGSVLIGARKNG